jgi:hypothetical protein
VPNKVHTHQLVKIQHEKRLASASPRFAGYCARFGADEHTPPYICINLRIFASICGFGWPQRVIGDKSGGSKVVIRHVINTDSHGFKVNLYFCMMIASKNCTNSIRTHATGVRFSSFSSLFFSCSWPTLRWEIFTPNRKAYEEIRIILRRFRRAHHFWLNGRNKSARICEICGFLSSSINE